jgi:hypothetical protein
MVKALDAMPVGPPEYRGWQRHRGPEGDEERRSKKLSCIAEGENSKDLPGATYLCCCERQIFEMGVARWILKSWTAEWQLARANIQKSSDIWVINREQYDAIAIAICFNIKLMLVWPPMEEAGISIRVMTRFRINWKKGMRSQDVKAKVDSDLVAEVGFRRPQEKPEIIPSPEVGVGPESVGKWPVGGRSVGVIR